MREIQGYMEEYDRIELLGKFAKYELVMAGAVCQFGEGVHIIKDYYCFFAQLRRKYLKKHDLEEREAIRFSLYDGAILIVDEDPI